MRQKCRDCGEIGYTPSKRREDVCEQCFKNRMRLLDARQNAQVTLEEFRDVQRAMLSGRGKAAGKIKRLLDWANTVP